MCFGFGLLLVFLGVGSAVFGVFCVRFGVKMDTVGYYHGHTTQMIGFVAIYA